MTIVSRSTVSCTTFGEWIKVPQPLLFTLAWPRRPMLVEGCFLTAYEGVAPRPVAAAHPVAAAQPRVRTRCRRPAPAACGCHRRGAGACGVALVATRGRAARHTQPLGGVFVAGGLPAARGGRLPGP